MSNTLKLGNGKWATGKDTVLAYNDLNSNYKPLAFSFSRDSSATVVNKDGLIETVGSGEPRIDFKDNTKGALLLEPTRSNLITYSEDFSNSYWSPNSNALRSLSSNLSPDGTANAYRVEAVTGTQVGHVGTTTIGTTITHSIWVRRISGSTTFNMVDVNNIKTSVNITSDWQRFSITSTATSTNLRSYFKTTALGDVVEIYGAQLEQGSYATSYIPTSGSAVTRVADSSSQTVPDGVIGQTEGTLFVETTKWVQSNNGRILSISDGTTSNYITIIQNTTFSNYAVYIASGGVTQVAYTETQAIPDNSKIAISYKQNDFTISVNGQIVHTDTSGVVPSTSKIYLGSRENGSTTYYSSNPIKVARIYNTRLSNSELATLTS